MSFRIKIIGGLLLLTVITLAVAGVGHWQTQKMAAALEQAGIVRLGSLQALDAIAEARSVLDASKRELLHEATVFEHESEPAERTVKSPPAGSAVGPRSVLTWAAWGDVLQEELKLQQEAWARAENGWKHYEALAHPPEEQAAWKDFTGAWNVWRTGYEKVMARLSRARESGDRTLLAAAREENYNHLFEPARVSHDLLRDLLAGNERSAAVTRQQAESTLRDVRLVGGFMLAAAGLSVAAALGGGIVLSWGIRRPIHQMAGAFAQLARGDLTARAPVGSRDEFGQLAEALNRMAESLRLGELRFRAVFENFPAAICVSKKSHVVLANPALPALFGYDTPEAVIGRPVFEFIAPEDRAFLLERIRLHDRDQALVPVYELTGLRKDGTKFAMEVHSAFFTFHGEKYTIDLQREVTGRPPEATQG